MVEIRNINIEVDADDVLDGLQSDLTLEKVIDRWEDTEEKEDALESMISDADPGDILFSLQNKYTLKQVIEKWPETGKAEDNKPASIVNLTTEEILHYLNESGRSFSDIVASWPDQDEVTRSMGNAHSLENLREALERVHADSTDMGTIADEIGKVFPLQDIIVHWPDNKQKEDVIIRMLANIIRR